MILTKIETNIKRKLFLHKTEKITFPISSNIIEFDVISVDQKQSFQTLLGFGGAFTESTGYSLSTVDEKIYNNIIDDYFLKDGLNYSLCRLPIGSCDFSLNSYSYSYKDNLSDFNIKRDQKYIIPTIKSAQERNKNIKFVSSPWSPPAFMKDNNDLNNGGRLLKKYKKTWAKYLVKYVQNYMLENINIDYMTIQNEPNASQSWESCRYTAEEESDLLRNYLFHIFKENNLKTKFLIWDHNKDNILERSINCLVQNGALNYASGIAFHWYTGSHFQNLSQLNKLFPNKLLIHTEGCTGYSNFNPSDELFNAEMYASEIIGDLNNGVNGFIDWNMVLEYNGRAKP